MKQRKHTQILAFLTAVLLVCSLCGCASRFGILFEENGDTKLKMEVVDYTGSIERTITIKDTQSGIFSIQFSPTRGNIRLSITDGNGTDILSMNERATLSDRPSILNVPSGNGAYKVTIQLNKYNGSFDITWDIT